MSPTAYADVLARLETERIRYVVVSGAAVVLHGHHRSIADLDLVVDPDPVELDRALRSLLRAGFHPTLPLPFTMVSVMRMFDQAGREIDVFVRYFIPFGEMWDESQCVRLNESPVRLLSLAQLLREKRRRGREGDLLDVAALEVLEKGVG